MKKIKKILKMVVIVLLALIVVVAILVKLFGNKALKTGIVAGSKTALKVDTRLDSVDLSIMGGNVELKGLEIDNPEGYEHPTFLKLGRGYVKLNTGSLLSDTIVIDSMQFENIEVILEQKIGTSNIKEILNNLPQAEPTEEEPDPEAAEKDGKNVQVTEIVIKDVKVKANLLPVEGMTRASTVTIPLKEIRLENVGTEEKINVPGLIGEIISAIAAGVFEQGKEILPVDMTQITETGKELLKSGQEAGTEILETGKDIGKEATDAIKDLGGLFKKKED